MHDLKSTMATKHTSKKLVNHSSTTLHPIPYTTLYIKAWGAVDGEYSRIFIDNEWKASLYEMRQFLCFPCNRQWIRNNLHPPLCDSIYFKEWLIIWGLHPYCLVSWLNVSKKFYFSLSYFMPPTRLKARVGLQAACLVRYVWKSLTN